MHNTTERIRRVKLRVGKKRYKRETRLLGGLSALCLVLFCSLIGIIDTIVGNVHGKAFGMYGAMLLHEDAGGYVLVAVIVFAAATVITVLCIRSKEKNKKI
jgi:hypothetical protein